MTHENGRSLVHLITDVMNEFTTLFQTEIRLFRAELNEKANRLAGSGALIAAGAVAAIVALVLLLQALVRWLAIAGIPEEWGLLIVGLVVAGLAAVLIIKGISGLKGTKLVPDRTIQQVRADFATVKEHVT
jgi:putative superfamily III holin-X